MGRDRFNQEEMHRVLRSLLIALRSAEQLVSRNLVDYMFSLA